VFHRLLHWRHTGVPSDGISLSCSPPSTTTPIKSLIVNVGVSVRSNFNVNATISTHEKKKLILQLQMLIDISLLFGRNKSIISYMKAQLAKLILIPLYCNIIIINTICKWYHS
jgi:hypothetical protein